MKKIIGYTDSINECDCCGKTELKGTYCIELDGDELYYGSVCAFKAQGLTMDEQKDLRAALSKQKKNNALIEKHITPMVAEYTAKIKAWGTDAFSLKRIESLERSLADMIQYKCKKYKIEIVA